jgi:hypothetical protein
MQSSAAAVRAALGAALLTPALHDRNSRRHSLEASYIE